MRRRSLLLLAVFVLLVGASAAFTGTGPDPTPAGAATAASAGTATTSARPVLPVSHHGRWLTDAAGRVLLVHGVNFVSKNPGESPTSRGFGADDIAWIVDNGFDVVRLGISPNNLMPTAGTIDTAYLASFVQTAHDLTAAGLLVLIDLHQDGWGPSVCGNGFPDWMTLTHGATNTCTAFPGYYISNPAIQASFQSLWDNDLGPGGVGLQDRVAEMFGAMAAALADDPGILGYEFLNEPWPGTTYKPCLYDKNGCPDLDAAGLDELHAKATAAVRAHDTTHLVFGEPYVAFNFGFAPTHIAVPANDANGGMAFHTYTITAKKEPVQIGMAVDWAGKTGGALLNTEFGATSDTPTINRLVGELDGALVPWIWWSYDEFMHDLDQTASDAHATMSVVDGIVRPHALAVAGTPTAQTYDPTARVLKTSWSTTGPDGSTLPTGTVSSIWIPVRTYPGGYSVRVTGGTVTSAPNANALTVVADPGAASVSVKVWAAGDPEPDPPAPTKTAGPSTTVVGTLPTTPAAQPVSAQPALAG